MRKGEKFFSFLSPLSHTTHHFMSQSCPPLIAIFFQAKKSHSTFVHIQAVTGHLVIYCIYLIDQPTVILLKNKQKCFVLLCFKWVRDRSRFGADDIPFWKKQSPHSDFPIYFNPSFCIVAQIFNIHKFLFSSSRLPFD